MYQYGFKISALGLSTAFSLVLFCSSKVFAQGSGAEISDVVYSGSGCPAGTAGVVISPDGKAVSVLFDRYIMDVNPREAIGVIKAENGGVLPTVGDRRYTVPGTDDVYRYNAPHKIISKDRSCIVRLKMNVPDNVRVKIKTVDLRGYSSVPEKMRGQIHGGVSYHARGQKPTKVDRELRRFEPGTDEEYILTYDVSQQTSDESWTPCGAKNVAMQISAWGSLRFFVGRAGGENGGHIDTNGIITLDTLDATTEDRGLRIGFETQACRN